MCSQVKSVGCDAIVTDFENVTVHAPRQGIHAYGTKPCSRKGAETVAHLHLCSVHARMAREGLVDRDGYVACRADIASVRRYPKKFPGGFYNWLANRTEKKEETT
jgi:hypothetical protein